MSLGMELSKVLMQHEPMLLDADPAACGRAMGEIANLLGCVMAPILQKKGQATYEAAFRVLMAKVNEAAKDVDKRALVMRANGEGMHNA